jgi:hypothetical protein
MYYGQYEMFLWDGGDPYFVELDLMDDAAWERYLNDGWEVGI